MGSEMCIRDSCNDQLYTWNTLNDDGFPHHGDVEVILQQFQKMPLYQDGYLIINPTGEYDTFQTLTPDSKALIQAQEPRMHPMENLGEDVWHFGAFEMGEEESDQLNWEEGNDGKGLLLMDGTLHTWNSEDYEIHADYLADHSHIDEAGSQFLYIDKNGKVTTTWGGLNPDQEEKIRERDPRLYVDIDEGGASPWQFGAAAE